MKTFEEWCNDREIVLNELSPKLLTMAYKIWGEECFVEGQRYEAENAALRERLKKAVEDVAERIKMAFYYEFEELIPSIMADKIDEIVKEALNEHELQV